MDVSAGGPGGLRPADVVMTAGATLALAVLLLSGQWAPGWGRSALVFAAIAAGPPLLRWLADRFTRFRVLDVAASFWLALAAPLGHLSLGPLVDTVSTGLYDRQLALMDLRLFRLHPAELAGRLLPGWAMDVLLCCYYTYFLWPVLAGAVLYARRERAAFEQLRLALAVCFTLNFAFYAHFPAVGPRFFLAQAFGAPLQGALVTPWLESLMWTPRFLRDCFPSGHTAVTVLILLLSWRHARWFFWVMLPAAAGLICATVAARFHYGVDLLAALPLAMLALGVAAAVVPSTPAPARQGRSLPAWRST